MFEALRNRLSHLRTRPDDGDLGAPTPAGRGARDPSLARDRIDRLRDLQGELIRAFDAVLECDRTHDFPTCLTRLREFDYRLQDYLLHDDAQFHAAMSMRLEGDADRLLLLRSVRARLRQLRRQVHELAYASMRDPSARSVRPDFGVAFQSMRKTLRSCLETEDTQLFALCEPGADAQASFLWRERSQA